MAALTAWSARARPWLRAPAAAQSLLAPSLVRGFARSLAGFKVSARIHAHMLLPVWRHGQFPALRSLFFPSLRPSHNFQKHGLKVPWPQRPSEILFVFLLPFLFLGGGS